MSLNEKICRDCLMLKPLSEFYPHPSCLTGHGHCKSCAKIRAAKWARDNPESRRKSKNTPYQLEMKKVYIARYVAKFPEKKKAVQTLNNAIRDGRAKRLPCDVCGSLEAQGHHEDYSKPLDVRWLCDAHHKAHHRQIKSKFPEKT